ncbi:hypothetical protein ACVGVM_24170 [Pseudonocardia bannensis]|uniref:hypothetical protein n=1 Tax=Pseudonocardia bannensis TaxID=630973 RepID=UPI001FE69111|nr:hypothetical protein [Pseudonocardia bannensis]
MRVLVLALLSLDSAMLAALALMLQPSYIGWVPVPIGTVLVLLTMPWLVRRAAEQEASSGVAGAPVLVWIGVVGVLGFGGPGGDVLLPATWQSLLLIVSGLGSGLWTLRQVLHSGPATADDERGSMSAVSSG